MKFLRKVYKTLKNELHALLMTVISELPSSGLGNRVRIRYWSAKLNKIKFKIVGRGVYIFSGDALLVGSGVELGSNVVIDNNNSHGIFIGNNVGIAKGSYIRTANHDISDLNKPYMEQGHVAKSIQFNGSTYSVVIEDDVWIGAHVIILSGAHISSGSIISAGSVVSGFIPEYSVVVGNPARVVINRKKSQVHQQSQEQGASL